MSCMPQCCPENNQGFEDQKTLIIISSMHLSFHLGQQFRKNVYIRCPIDVM
jgi:hypothetical protein